MNARVARAGWWARQVLLSVGAVVGVLCLLVTLGALLFGLRPLVFQSGSMSPAIHTGDLALSHSVAAAGLEEGDVVSVPTEEGERVTHRIVSLHLEDGEAVLVLRGDANEAADATPYRVDRADVVLFHVPRLGYVVGWLSSPLGLFLLGLYAAFLLSVLLRRPTDGGPGATEPLSPEPRIVPPVRRIRSWRRPRTRRRAMLAGGLSAILALGCVGGLTTGSRITPTQAAWNDEVPVSASTFQTVTVPPPTLSCTWNFLYRTFTWTAVPGATSYDFYSDTDADPVNVTGTSRTWPITAGTQHASVVAKRAFSGGATWSSVRSNVISYAPLADC